MFESFSALGFVVQTPCGPRKSGTPDSVEMPAPVKATIRVDADTQRRAKSISFPIRSVSTGAAPRPRPHDAGHRKGAAVGVGRRAEPPAEAGPRRWPVSALHTAQRAADL